MNRVHYDKPIDVSNVVVHTEQGRKFLRRMLAGLRDHDAVPPVLESGPSSRIALLNDLRRIMAEALCFDDAVSRLKESSYFRPYVEGHAVSVVQVRNNLPSDSTVVYRHADGDFNIDGMFSVAHVDPTGPLVTGGWLLPPTRIRKQEELQRSVFGMHEFSEPKQLLESSVYRTVYDDLRVSWHAIILERTEEFTWVFYLWYSVEHYEQLASAVRYVRAGLNKVALILAEQFQAELKHGAFRDERSLKAGMLVFDPGFRRLRRQNFTAEMIIRGLNDPYEGSISRASIAARLELEYLRRRDAGLPTRWAVDAFFHSLDSFPTDIAPEPAVEVTVEGRRGEMVVTLEERHLPYLPALKWWHLDEHSGLGVATAIRQLGDRHRQLGLTDDEPLADGYFIRSAMCVARPIWDVDVVADRVQHYYRVTSKDLGRHGLKIDFRRHSVCALLFRGKAVGVLQAV